MDNNVTIQIGTVVTRFQSSLSFKIAVESGYESFIVSDLITQELTIDVQDTLPPTDASFELVFSSTDGNIPLWNVYKNSKHYLIETFYPGSNNHIQAKAIIDFNSNVWSIFCLPQDDGHLYPVQYPMGPLLLYYTTLLSPSILIHASGIVDGGKGRLFTAFSGTGKSTMAGLWHSKGSSVINDDRLLLKIEDSGIKMFNTPMFYHDKIKSHPLNAIYLLKQTKEHTIKRLNNAEAVSRLMAFCIQHGYDRGFLEHHLMVVYRIFEQVPIYELGFRLDVDVIDFIKANDD